MHATTGGSSTAAAPVQQQLAALLPLFFFPASDTSTTSTASVCHRPQYLYVLNTPASTYSFILSSLVVNMLPLGILHAAQGHPILIELKSGETLNGHLVQCDTWMNFTLKEVVQTNPDGDKFVRLPEAYVKGNNIKYLRMPDEIIDIVKEQQQQQQQNRHHQYQGGFRGGRGGQQRGDHSGRGGDRGRGGKSQGRGLGRGRGS